MGEGQETECVYRMGESKVLLWTKEDTCKERTEKICRQEIYSFGRQLDTGQHMTEMYKTHL